jgi:hypothetical protein
MSDEEKDTLKEELKAKLEAQGVEVDYRWGVPKMESVLAELAIQDEQVPEETVTVPESDPVLEGDETPLEEEAAPEPEAPAEQPEGTLRCRVTKKGHNKIFTGKEDPKYFEWEAIVFLPPEGARQLEDRSFVEILDEPLDE